MLGDAPRAPPEFRAMQDLRPEAAGGDRANIRARMSTSMQFTNNLDHREALGVARAEIAAGDDVAADRRIRAVLDATRADRPPVWWLAVANLIGLYMRQEREVESLRLARVAADGYRHDRPEDRAYGLQTLCMAFANIEDHVRLGRELPRFEESIAACDAPARAMYGRSIGLLRTLVALERGELAEARRLVEDVIASFDESATAITRGPAHYIAAMVAHRDGRFADGRASAALARANAPTPSAGLPALFVETQCALATGGPADALETARGAVARIETMAHSSHEPSHVVQAASRLAELVADRCYDEALARRLLDAAVAAVLRRAEQLDRVADDFPELAPACADDEIALAAYRARFRDARGRLLAAVARVLSGAPASGAFLRMLDDGLLCVCAWCLRVRRRDGVWTPLGHFVDDGSARVTHDVCADCASRLGETGPH